MKTTIGLGILGAAIIIGAGYYFSQKPQAAHEEAALATPPGITIGSAKVGMADSGVSGMKMPVTKPSFADAKGMTLYTFDKDVEPGKSACSGDCAKAWPAMAAPKDARPFGDWSLVTRDDGSKQWAYRGKPLYTSTKDAKLGDANGANVDNVWHIAFFAPADGMPLPDGVAVQELLNAGGEVFVNSEGNPLYTFDGDRAGKPSCTGAPCADHWTPFEAAQLAKPVGDFTVVHRDDGIYQWAYKGQPLYAYTGDTEPGDAKGNGLDGKWHVATLVRQFMPPGVAIAQNRFGGDNLVTAAGMTLYERDRVVSTNTGHNLRAGMRGNPLVGRMLGTKSCDAACAKTWHPLLAAADAQPSGYWDIATRDDGTRQWVYRGYAVYTFAGDQKPGDMKGNDTYDILEGNDPYAVADVFVKGAGAMVWHTAIP
ncbi:MAG TPA: hypothetical protein VKZ79_19810 [Alphaproteobacteria bacterium]|nr:hypothetical protein [Alphaproteobacteria bacterium]